MAAFNDQVLNVLRYVVGLKGGFVALHRNASLINQEFFEIPADVVAVLR